MFTRNKISALQEIRSWNSLDVLRALNKNGLSEVCEVFKRRQIDGDELLDLTEGRLALWKKDLSFTLVRKISNFVADINAAPAKYLLSHEEEEAEYTELDDVEYLNIDSDIASAGTASWLENLPPPPVATYNPTHSPVDSETGSWDTDFDDDVGVNEAPFPHPPTPAPSALHRPSIPVKPGFPQRPPTKILNDRYKPFNNGKICHTSTSSLPKPPEPKLESIISSIKFRKSIPNDYSLEDDEEYYEIEPELQSGQVRKNQAIGDDEYLDMEPAIPARPNVPPQLPSREPKFNHPRPPAVGMMHTPPPRDRKVIPSNIPKHNIPKQDQSQLPILPPREYLTKPKNVIGTSPIPPRKYSYTNHPLPQQDPDDAEYEFIEDPGQYRPPAAEKDDYLEPIVRQKPSDYPMLPPVSPSRRESDASSTTSSGSDKLAIALKRALSSRPFDEREKTATPELHKAPVLPAKASSVDRAQFATNQRPLPPTPEPKRQSERSSSARIKAQPYYFNVDRKRAEEKLKNREDGCFLLRPSTRTENPFTLTLWFNRRPYNIYVRLRTDGRYALGSEKDKEQTFASVEELIAYYRKEQLVLYSVGERTGTTALVSYPAQDQYSASPF